MLRIRSTYLYLAVALGLFCYIYFIDFKFKSTDERAQAAGNLYDFRADRITHLEITNSSGTTVLEKHDDRWKITKPVQAFPEAGVVQQVLGELEFIRSERIIRYSTLPGVKEETIKQWNLNPPVVRVAFSSPQESHVLLIGRNVALTETVYARASAKPDAPIYIIRAASKMIIDRSLTDLRSHAVFDFNSLSIDKASVREFTSAAQVARDVEIAKDKENNWALQKPLVARAEKARVDAWLKQVQDLRVVNFISDESSNLSTYGLSSPVAQITVQRRGEGEELSLIIGTSPQDKPQEVYAKRLRSNSVFTLNKEAVAKLLTGLPECRDKKLISIPVADVVGLSIEQKGKVLAVRKKDGVWMFDGEEVRAEAGKVQDFVNRMALLQSTQFVKDAATDLRPYGLDKPQTKVTLRYGKDKETASVDLLFGKVDTKQIYAMSSAEPFIYSVPSGALDTIPKDVLLWRDAQVLRLAPDTVKEVTFINKDGESTTLVRESKDAYKTTAEGYVVDAGRAEAQVSILCNLRATQWIGKPLPIYTLDKPSLQIVITTTTEGKTVLRVGAPLMSGGHAAQIEGQPSAFELSLADFSALGQSVLTKAPAQVATPPADAPKK